VIPAGTIDGKSFTAFPDVDHFQTAAIAFLKLPVTSVRGFASYVRNTALALKRPPFGVFTRVWIEPDARSQFRVRFEALGKVPASLGAVMIERNEEAAQIIAFPYPSDMVADGEKPKRKRTPKKTSRKKKATGRKF
jgi:hypothetical protein